MSELRALGTWVLLAATASLLDSCLHSDGARHSGAVTGVLEGRLVVGLDDDIDGITTVIVIPTTDAECNSGASLSSLDDAVGHSIEFTRDGDDMASSDPPLIGGRDLLLDC